MSEKPSPRVALRPWSASDLWLLERLLGDPAMMRHLGGPDTRDAIRARHERYLASDPARGGLFAIVLGADAEPVGWVGYWESEWRGETVWECGWHVLPERQGRGVATGATRLVLERARTHGMHRHIHAFPATGNAASNALCRRLGFTLLGEADVEYPAGSTMRSNDWVLDLGSGLAATASRRLTPASLRRGTRRLADSDPDLGAVVDRLGEPPMWGRDPGFPALVRIILEQQVSLAAARTMYRRLTRHLGGMTPESVHAAQVAGLRDLGLTSQKAGYCHGLAERVLSGSLDLTRVARGPDDVGRRDLLAVPGLGPWSVDIYYLMALRRPDVWPEGDLALASALREVKRLDALPAKEEQRVLASSWAPWRSVAARILWAHYLAARGRYAARPDGGQAGRTAGAPG